MTDNQGRIFVNIEDTNEVVELDGNTLKITKRYSLPSCLEPTSMAIDTETHRVFSGCLNQVMTVLDYASGTVTATIPIGKSVDGVVYDKGMKRIITSNGEGTLTVVRETSPNKFETETVPTQRAARTVALDPETHRLYLPTAEFESPPPAAPDNPKPKPVMKKGSFTVLVVDK